MIRLARLLVLALLLPVTCRAQLGDSLRAHRSLTFKNVNLSRVPTGYLAEYGEPYGQLKCYGGVRGDSNNVTRWHYLNSYHTLQTAQVKGADSLETLEAYDARLQAAASDSVITLGIVAGRLSIFRPDAPEKGLVSISGRALTTYDTTQSPFTTQRLLLACPSAQALPVGRRYYLKLPAACIKTLGGLAHPSVTVRVNGGEPMPAGNGQTILLDLRDTARRFAQLTVRAVAGSVAMETDVYLRLTPAPPPAPATYGPGPDHTEVIPAPWPIGIHSGGRLHIRYAANNPNPALPGGTRLLQRPFLVIPGFDASHFFRAPYLSGQIVQFLDGVFNGKHLGRGFDYAWAVDWLSKVGLDQLLDDGTPFNPGADRDLLVLEWFDGTDAIERNAELFKAVVAYINANKAANAAETVVLAHSMGGLVARFGLTTMDQNGADPQVSDLITYDSPHRGVNVPVGVQFLARDLTLTPVLRVNPGAFVIDNLMNAPATGQMLLYKAVAGTGDGLIENSWLNQTYRPMVDYANSGATQSFRLHTFSLGSECNVRTLNPEDMLATFFMGGVFDGVLFGTIFPRVMIINAHAWATPEAGANGKVATYEMIAVGPFIGWGIAIDIIWRESYYNKATSYDFVHGGTYPIAFNGGKGLVVPVPPIQIFGALIIGITSIDIPSNEFTFVPVASALDQPMNTQADVERPYNALSPLTNNARISTFITEQPTNFNVNGNTVTRINLEHTDITFRAADHIIAIAKGLPAPANSCLPACQPIVPIIGPRLLCPSAPVAFRIVAQPGDVAIWSVQGASFVPGQDAFSILVTSGQAHQATVSVTVRRNGCYIYGQKQVELFLGHQIDVLFNPSHNEDNHDPNTVCNKHSGYRQDHLSLELDNWDGKMEDLNLRDIVWTAADPACITATQGGYAEECTIKPADNSPYSTLTCSTAVQVTATCDCGALSGTYPVAVTECTSIGRVRLNPPIGIKGQTPTLRVSLLPCQDCPNPQNAPVRLLDARGQNMIEAKLNPSGFIDLDVSGLSAAEYVVAVDGQGYQGEKLTWNLVASPGKQLTVSPNPARKDVDDSISVSVATAATGKYDFILTDFGGQPLYHTSSASHTARLPMQGLAAGTYQVIASNADTSWTEDVDFLYKAAPYMTLSPNPASTMLTATVNDPLYSTFKAEWHVTDAATGDELANGTGNGPAVDIDVSQLPPGRQLTLTLNDGYMSYYKHFQVQHR